MNCRTIGARCFLQPQLVGVVDDVAGFVAQDAHAPLVLAALDGQHLRLLEALEPRMREIEGHRHRRLAVGREPLVRQIKVKREVKTARRELALQLIDARLDDRARERQRQIREAEIEQFVVAQIGPVAGNRAGHGGL